VPGSCIRETTALSASCYNIKHHSLVQHDSDFDSDTQQSSTQTQPRLRCLILQVDFMQKYLLF